MDWTLGRFLMKNTKSIFLVKTNFGPANARLGDLPDLPSPKKSKLKNQIWRYNILRTPSEKVSRYLFSDLLEQKGRKAASLQ